MSDSKLAQRDPFIIGLEMIMKERQLKPATLAKDAGLNDSTLRKQLSGENRSMNMTTAVKIAETVGVDLSTIIALGEHSEGPEIVRLVLKMRDISPEERQRVDSYLQVATQSRTPSEGAPNRPAEA